MERDDCLSYITFVRKSNRTRHKSCFARIGVGLENLTVVGFPAILTMGIVRMSVIVDCIAVLIILD